ncbi:ATPase [Sorangium cellulosum]|uniref:ATPase n=1 Tax=Sorangium cellulosum TaxID=56 RepID=A0A2L0EYD9_SORCE|nr:ATP-binding protein [Sorangium cellulosum]AUX44300.1 ATPase [Sorangium cellulosum]
MLAIQRLTIHQLRGLRDLDLPGLGRFNVLVGLNNSGKTTVLEAVALYSRPLRPSEWVEVARRRDVTYSRAAILEGLRWLFPQREGSGADSSPPFQESIRLTGEGRFAVREATARLKELEGFFDEADTSQPGLPDLGHENGGTRRGAELELRALVEAQKPDLFGAAPLREESFPVVLWETGRGPIAQNSSGPALPVATITPFSHRVQQLEVEAFSDAIFADLKPTVLDLVRIFDPGIQDFEVLKRPRSEPAVYVRHARLGKAPLSTFGDGMRRVLLMGVSLATARGGVLLVDEIESAIHAEALDAAFRWLQRVCRQLDVQLFTTTHSIEAVDALLAASEGAEELVVYRLERKGDRTRAKRFPNDQLRVLREELGQEIRV